MTDGLLSPDWGVWCLTLALLASGVQIVAGLLGGVWATSQTTPPTTSQSRSRHPPRLASIVRLVRPPIPRAMAQTIAKRAAVLAFATTAAAFLILIALFLASDFSVDAVARYSHAAKPLVYKIAAAWGNHEGSMVMWCVVLTGVGAWIARKSGVNAPMTATTLAILGALTIAFLLYTLITSNPLTRLPSPPWSGRGFNPLLQDPAVALHPPLLYLGYVGLAAPFALACAALLHAPDAHTTAWARAIRGWTLLAFAGLTLGIGMGGYWAYYELGWGGWWAWDPVENASLMPWIFAAALLHSAMVTEKRGTLAAWTILLAIGAFALSLLGTFLTRSGAVTSVHAFANDPARGLVLLAMLAVMLLAALTLFALRADRLSGHPASTDLAIAPASREGLLVANNLFLVVTALVVLTGTLMPLFAEALGQPVSVGTPYYNKAALPIAALAFLLTPLATRSAWGKALPRLQRKTVIIVATGFGSVTLAVMAAGGPLGAGVAIALGLWLLLGAGLDAHRKLFAKGQRQLKDALALTRAKPALLAAILAHAGIGLLAIGAAGEAAFSTSRTMVIGEGETMDARGGQVRLRSIEDYDGPNYSAAIANVEFSRPGQRTVALSPEWRRYWVQGQTTSEVAIRSGVTGDVYVAFGPPQIGPDNTAIWTVRVLEKPLIGFVFAGMLLIAIGAGLAGWGVFTKPPEAT